MSLAACLSLSEAPVAQPSSRSAADNPFVPRLSPLDRQIGEWRLALRLDGEQEKLFAALERELREAAQDREAAIVASAIDRNREERLPADPGELLRARADRLSRLVDGLRRLADAETAFFGSLSEDQRRVADKIVSKEVLGLYDQFRRRGPRADRNG